MFASACRSRVEVARAEMDDVYRTSKDIQANFAAGVGIKQLTDLKVRLDSELRIIDDRIHSSSSVRNRLQPYRNAYFKALQACDLVARVVDFKLRVSACQGEEPAEFSLRDLRGMPTDEAVSKVVARADWMGRVLQCSKKYGGEVAALGL